MKAPNPIALTAAVLFTTVSLATISPSTPVFHAAYINGEKVIDLAPVVVHPSADDRRAAALLAAADVSIVNTPIAHHVDNAATLLGAQLSMPYYSFGSTKLTGISKE